MKYNTIDLLDSKIESIIKHRVKHYYSDWKNYDRVKYMRLKGSENKKDKYMILLARTCGTYLFSGEELETYKFSYDCIDYYYNAEKQNTFFYAIDLNKMTVKKLQDNEIETIIRNCKANFNNEVLSA